MFRDFLKKDAPVSSEGFRYRGLQSSRLENITDAVFGFAITLLVISLEVPKSYVELQASLYSFPGFVICTGLLLLLWNSHYVFFKKYGLEDNITKTLNFFFLFLLLFYVYPLKYLFNILGTLIWLKIKLALGDKSEAMMLKIKEFQQLNLSGDQWQDLMITYGLGALAIYAVILLFHMNALRQKEKLELNEIEIYDTKVQVWANVIMMAVPAISIMLVYLLHPRLVWISGMIYSLYGIFLPVYHRIAERRRKHIYGF